MVSATLPYQPAIYTQNPSQPILQLQLFSVLDMKAKPATLFEQLDTSKVLLNAVSKLRRAWQYRNLRMAWSGTCYQRVVKSRRRGVFTALRAFLDGRIEAKGRGSDACKHRSIIFSTALTAPTSTVKCASLGLSNHRI